MDHDAADVSALSVSVFGRPVITAARDLLDSHGGDLDELRDALLDNFGPRGRWCEVGDTVHSHTMGDAETRLRPTCGRGWHADLFGGGWDSPRLVDVPAESRVPVAAYVDGIRDLPPLATEDDLRAAALEGAAEEVDQLVRDHVRRLDRWHTELDALHCALPAAGDKLPAWAVDFIRYEVQDHARAREWLASAVLAYHHGAAGERPEMIFGGMRYTFTNCSVELFRR